jgi:GMP synthase (glutamine-hydrolysing)
MESPYLGICFGAQLLAVTLGSHFTNATTDQAIDHGVVPIQLTDSGLRDPVLAIDSPFIDVIHWHSECFEDPPGAEILAYSTSQPKHVEMFRQGKSVYGFQFHPEVTFEAILKDPKWLPENANPAGVKAAADHGNRILANYFEILSAV